MTTSLAWRLLTGFGRDELIATLPIPFWPPESAADTRGIRDRVVDQEGGTFELGNTPGAPAGDLYARADPALSEAKRRVRDRSCARAMVSVETAAAM